MNSDRGVFGVDGGAAACQIMRRKRQIPLHNDSSLMLMLLEKGKAAVTGGSCSAIYNYCDREMGGYKRKISGLL